jgi:hypothetical protein
MFKRERERERERERGKLEIDHYWIIKSVSEDIIWYNVGGLLQPYYVL